MSKLFDKYKKYFEDALRAKEPGIAVNILRHRTFPEQGITYDQAYELFKEFASNEISKPVRDLVKEYLEGMDKFNKYREKIITAWKNDWKEHKYPENQVMILVNELSKEGLSKKQIFRLVLEFHSFTAYSNEYDANQVEILEDFLDGFTPMAKGNRILPDEDDVK